MRDKIKALSDKALLIIGAILIFIDIIFLVVALSINGMYSSRWIDFIYYALFAIGLVFIMMAYKKKMQNK